MLDEKINNFHNEVVLKYYLYNSLFLTLPFGGTEEAGTLLSLFAKYCETEMAAGRSPEAIINDFFAKQVTPYTESNKLSSLFSMSQFVERQILLFDALEDAAFALTHDLSGVGSFKNLINKVLNKGQQQCFITQIPNYQIKIVLTAHPTQFYPAPILTIMNQLVSALRANDLKNISQLLLQLGKTSFKYQQKPTPYEEAQSIAWYLENIFYKTIATIQQQVNEAMLAFGGRVQPENHCIELGFWPGGDRDGNPNVTADTTLQVAKLLKTRLLKLYLNDLSLLANKLTFAGIIEKLTTIRKKMQATYFDSQWCTSKKSATENYKDSQQFLRDLNQLKHLLITKHNALFLNHLDDLIIKVNCFGFYFAPIDMRENAHVQHDVFKLILSDLNYLPDYASQTDAVKIALLKQLITKKIKYTLPEQQKNSQLINFMRSLAVIKPIQLANGEKGLCRYVISNTGSACDVLELLTLLHLGGKFSGAVAVDLIPLFESIVDLENAESILETLCNCDFYRQHLKARAMTQIVMLGFSDGTKDGGYVAANWAIYKAKLRLTAIAEQYKIKIIFFDGRGGPPARGGGNTHLFYRSLGRKISHRNSQLTIQGQTISTNFGTEDSAKYNVEQLLTAGLEDLIFTDQANDLSIVEMQLLDELAQLSYAAYRQLKDDELFVPYLEQMTPLKFYAELNIGSRPVARKKSHHLHFKDLRAIPFVGSWSQLKQNIPGYYGFGLALQQLIAAGKLPLLRDFYQHSLFFRTLIENTMMSLSKTFFPLTAYMHTDKKFGQFWQQLADEAKLTQELLLLISKQSQLLADDPLNRESIQLRETIVLPLLIIQQFALIKLQKLAAKDKKLALVYKKLVLKALAANTNASRNSA